MQNPPPFPVGEPAFVADLRSPEIPGIRYNAASCAGFRPEPQFPDPEKLLDTAYFQLTRFLHNNGIDGKIPIRTQQCADLAGEAWRLRKEPGAVILESGSQEGIRRGIYELIEQLTNAPDPVPVERTPWLKNRISRCFFGPIKRAPFFRDELKDEIDYYPEEYLQKLARDGVNGIWLTIEFREICRTPYFPEDPDAAGRRAKLRQTVERCRRYGIKVWVFAIEPIYWSEKNPPPPDHPEWVGPSPRGWNLPSFCPDSESARDYLYQSTFSLFSEVPHLGGLMMISHGERITSCLSTLSVLEDRERPCPKCRRTPAEILQRILFAMRDGMRDANPDAELVSWLYHPWAERHADWIYHLPDKLDKGIILAYNAESGVQKMQAGKRRIGGDYWQSAPISDRFGRMASAARSHCRFAAKLQVCCSHELATVPFIPVPGMLYRKYKSLHDLGVTDVLQCWYFGNYPGMMNRAAGKLAFCDFTDGEDAFLQDLSVTDWGNPYADQVVRAWKKFTAAYDCYPLDIQMQYYGPMHAGAVWPLHLKRSMTRLPRSWQPDAEPAGDAIGECLGNFTLQEAAALTRKLNLLWQEGMAELQTVPESAGPAREKGLYEALGFQFQAAADILEFYRLRTRLMDGADVLEPMRAIVKREIAVSARLKTLAEQDSRLGYHSEAEVFLYFPEKLAWRMAELQRLMDEDFPAYENAPDKRQWLAGNADMYLPDTWYKAPAFRWRFDREHTIFELEYAPKPESRFVLYFADEKLAEMPWSNLVIHADGTTENDRDAVNVKLYGNRMQISIEPGMLPAGRGFFFAIRHEWQGGAENFPEKALNPPVRRLNFDCYTPEHLGFLSQFQKSVASRFENDFSSSCPK